MSTDLATERVTLPEGYPFHIGSRILNRLDADGKNHVEYIPLTIEDFIHPQEEDRFMIVDRHRSTVAYIAAALESRVKKDGRRVFSDHVIDWQVEGMKPHGPDAVVFRNFWHQWDDLEGTLMVQDMGAEPIVVIEVTSPRTRKADFEEKYLGYQEVGVPCYVIVDFHGPNGMISMLGFELIDGEYQSMEFDENLGFFIPGCNLSIHLMDGEVVMYDDDGIEIPRPSDSIQMLKSETERADAEAKRAKTALQRAKAETKRADSEAQKAKSEAERADRLAAELAELKRRLESSENGGI
jgi:colicin import membrane protein